MSAGSRCLLAELPVASLLIYPSRHRSEADREARDVIWTGVKQASPVHLSRVGQRLAELPARHPVRRVIPAGSVLIPVPRSAPLARGAVWPALQIAEALQAAGVGELVLPLLVRDEPVRRSTGARSAAEREPPMRHYQTISSTTTRLGVQNPTGHYVLIDDVVTTGSTLIACASRLAALMPDASIMAFAVARAERDRSLTVATEMLSPTVETIRLSADDARPRRS